MMKLNTKSWKRGLNKTLDVGQNGEQTQVDYYTAIRKLKEADQKLSLIKNRTKVLELKASKGHSSHNDIVNKSIMMEEIRFQTEQTRRKYQEIKLQQIHETQSLRKRSLQHKKEQALNLQKKRQQILQNRHQINEEIKQRTIQNEEKINAFRIQQLQLKRKLRREKYQKEHEQKDVISNFMQSRILEVKQNKKQQAIKILEKLKQRELQISKISEQRSKFQSVVQQLTKKRQTQEKQGQTASSHSYLSLKNSKNVQKIRKPRHSAKHFVHQQLYIL